MEELRLRYQEEEMQWRYPQAHDKERLEAYLAETETTAPRYPYPLKIKEI